MNIYLLSQYEYRGYDTYDSCVVYAESEDKARQIHPSISSRTWASCPENVDVSYLGSNPQATEPGLILASFNAG